MGFCKARKATERLVANRRRDSPKGRKHGATATMQMSLPTSRRLSGGFGLDDEKVTGFSVCQGGMPGEPRASGDVGAEGKEMHGKEFVSRRGNRAGCWAGGRGQEEPGLRENEDAEWRRTPSAGGRTGPAAQSAREGRIGPTFLEDRQRVGGASRL